MLLNLHKKSWMDGLMLSDYTEHCKINESTVNEMLDLAKNYNKVSAHPLGVNLTSVSLEAIRFFDILVRVCILRRVISTFFFPSFLQGFGRRRENDARTVGYQKCRKTRPEETFGRESKSFNVVEYRTMFGSDGRQHGI